MAFRMMRRTMEKETRRRCNREDEIYSCYSYGYSSSFISHLDAPPDRDARTHV